MRVNGESVWLREYLSSRSVPEKTRIEGVEYAKQAPSAKEQSAPEDVRDQAGTGAAATTELQALLTPEEEQLIRQLFPGSGPDWGARAYEVARKVAQQPPDEPDTDHIDLIG